MTSILRNFFYSFGLAVLCSAYLMNPETAALKHFLGLLHETTFWQLTGLFALVLVGAEMVFTAKIGVPARRIATDIATPARPQ